MSSAKWRKQGRKKMEYPFRTSPELVEQDSQLPRLDVKGQPFSPTPVKFVKGEKGITTNKEVTVSMDSLASDQASYTGPAEGMGLNAGKSSV